MKKTSLIALLVLAIQLSGWSQLSTTNSTARQQGGQDTVPQAESSGTVSAKGAAKEPTLKIGEGVWSANIAFDDPVSDQLKTFMFSVQTNTPGMLFVPIYFSSGEPRVETNDSAIMLVQKKVVHSFSVQDFSKVGRFSDSNNFSANFPFDLNGTKYSVVVKGKFLSDKSASGSISVASESREKPTVYNWEAVPLPHGTH